MHHRGGQKVSDYSACTISAQYFPEEEYCKIQSPENQKDFGHGWEVSKAAGDKNWSADASAQISYSTKLREVKTSTSTPKAPNLQRAASRARIGMLKANNSINIPYSFHM